MPADATEAQRRLAAITDPSVFERVATATLRMANPIYRSLVHTGINAEGKPVKAPVDGVLVVAGSDPLRFIAFHHTTFRANTLRRKWLGIEAGKEGDLIKTICWAAEIRQQVPDAKITLVLTTNAIPSPTLIADVNIKARANGIEIDLWDLSRLTHELNHTAEGHWLRQHYLGITQEHLDRNLLREMSRRSLENFPKFESPELCVPRSLDKELDGTVQAARDVTFLVAESGFGKSVACRALLNRHIDRGGYGLMIPHHALEDAPSLDVALDKVLHQLHASLQPDAGPIARSLCSENEPLLLVVEDINTAQQPAFLVERLASWSIRTSGESGSQHAESRNWRLICPIWPQVIGQLREAARKAVDQLSLYGGPLTVEEATAAILRRAGSWQGSALSLLEASEIADALGCDPLLIGLYEPEPMVTKPDPGSVIGDFVDRSLRRVSQGATGRFHISELRQALRMLAMAMLENRRFSPGWTELTGWFAGAGDTIAVLREVIHRREIGFSDSDTMIFRHDRIRDWILAEAIANEMATGQVASEVLEEPFYAELIGRALTIADLNKNWIDTVCQANVLALFHALKIFRVPTTAFEHRVVDVIRNWIGRTVARAPGNQYLRWEAQRALADTDSPLVLDLAARFFESSWPIMQAQFRNGDIRAGIDFCCRVEPGSRAPWRDKLVSHAVEKFGDKLVGGLIEVLSEVRQSGEVRTGALHLAGHLADPRLAGAIRICWDNAAKPPPDLGAFIWAGARCGGGATDELLAPMCHVWGTLPSRDSIMASGWDSAMWRGLSDTSLQFFIRRAEGKDLAWPITFTLRGMDHPSVVEFLCRQAGKYQWFFSQQVLDIWDPRSFGRDQTPMSGRSRERLSRLWGDRPEDYDLQIHAFRLWAISAATTDLPILQSIGPTSPLYEYALRARMSLGDRSSFSGLRQKLRETQKRGYWWQFCRYVWSDEFESQLDLELIDRGAAVKRAWGGNGYETDWIISELLVTQVDDRRAEALLEKHWDHLRFSPKFVQAALFVATARTRELASQSLTQAPEPRSLLQYVHHRLSDLRHYPFLSLHRLESFIPYLDLLSDFALHHFWELCNEQGWFAWRRQNLDGRYPARFGKPGLDDADLRANLDEFAADGRRRMWIDRWVERFAERGDPSGLVIEIVAKWLDERRTLTAFQVASQILLFAGDRSDLEVLNVDCPTIAEAILALKADLQFAVKRRSLI